MKAIEFMRESLRNLKTVGTLTQSSRYLCKNMVSYINFANADLIIELGAGDGVITKHILKKLKPGARLLAFEVNPLFCTKLRSIGDPRLQVVEDSAENLGKYLEEIGASEVDYVVSAIPFVALPKEDGRRIVQVCHDYLKGSGLYIQVHYSLILKRLYESIFGNVDINFVALNVPPAFVLVSEKK